ncbi:TOPRS ligase, partial [Halcyon senegalensis]|nr:TOPRS ligase [Halcyon senegalensis]
MATEWSCPICHNTGDFAYAMPCRHQFCLRCSLHWTVMTPQCPLCREPIETVRMPVQEGDNIQMVVTCPEESPGDSSQAGSAPSDPAENSPHHPVASPPSSQQGTESPAEQGATGREAVGGLLPLVWAELFQRQKSLLDPMLPWLHQELEVIYGPEWWRAQSAESIILYALCLYGPDEEAMVRMLQPGLGVNTEWLVHGVINTIVLWCSEEAQRLLHSCAGREDNSSAASSASGSSIFGSSVFISSQGATPVSSLASSTSPVGSDQEEAASMTEAALRVGPTCTPSEPGPAEPQQPQEEPVEAAEAAAAGPSARGRSRSSSTSRRGSGRSAAGSRRPAKWSGASSPPPAPGPAEPEQSREE